MNTRTYTNEDGELVVEATVALPAELIGAAADGRLESHIRRSVIHAVQREWERTEFGWLHGAQHG
jgi:hypothetical protein